ncbi:MAG TPA: hypothetical protein EYP71_06605 [Dehalococcoidia bacterium]|nr:hypothetical protein [Dehalococcoidia bacterium]
MVTAATEELIAKAKEELQKMRENRQRWGVSFEIKNIQEYLSQAGVGLDAIGTSEEELQESFKMGHTNAAKTWLQMARERCRTQDVSTEVGYIRSLVAEANITLDAIGTSEEELNKLLAAYKPARNWLAKLFRRKDTT